MKQNKKIDLVILILLPILTVLISLAFKTNFLISTLLFFGLPSIWLSFRHKGAIKKSFLFSILFTVPLVFIVDYIMVVSKGWYIIDTVFSFRLFKLIALEQFIWGILFCYFLIMFYEYFLDRPEKKSIFEFLKLTRPKSKGAINKAMEDLSWFLFLCLLIFFIILTIEPQILKIHFPYLILGTIIILIPLTLFLFKFPNFWLRFIKATLYFAYLAVIVEFIGIKLHHWIFPGTEFLGLIPFFGFIIPFEEYFFYFTLGAAGFLAYYEFFDDDRK